MDHGKESVEWTKGVCSALGRVWLWFWVGWSGQVGLAHESRQDNDSFCRPHTPSKLFAQHWSWPWVKLSCSEDPLHPAWHCCPGCPNHGAAHPSTICSLCPLGGSGTLPPPQALPQVMVSRSAPSGAHHTSFIPLKAPSPSPLALEGLRGFLVPSLCQDDIASQRRLCTGKVWALLEECYVIIIIIIITITTTTILSSPRVWSGRVVCKPHVGLVDELSWACSTGWLAKAFVSHGKTTLCRPLFNLVFPL